MFNIKQQAVVQNVDKLLFLLYASEDQSFYGGVPGGVPVAWSMGCGAE